MDDASNLEVDARHNGLHASYAGSEPKYKAIEPDRTGGVDSGAHAYQDLAAEQPRKILGLRRTTFALSTLLVIVLVLGIVSAVGAGSCASKNGGFTGSNPPVKNAPIEQQQGQTASPTTTPALPGNNSTHNDTATLVPTTSCSTLGSHYSAKVSDQQFTLYCDTDFVGNDFIGIFVYKFEDCIEACASFNRFDLYDKQCSHLAYTTNTTAFGEAAGEGNCFLKNGTGNGAGNTVTSGAVVVKVS